MARQKKLTSKALELGQTRLSGMKSIDPKLDFGKGLSVKSMDETVTKLTAEIGVYNTMLSTLDDKLNGIKKLEKELTLLSTRVLKRVQADYGPDSTEYEQVGGVRASERKKPKAKTPA